MDIDKAVAILNMLANKEAAAKEEAKTTAAITITRNGAYTPKKKVEHMEKAPVAVHKTGEAVFGLSFPEAGQLDAAGFMSAIRRVGMVKSTAIGSVGKIVYDQSKVRDMTIQAISAYVGYDPTGNFAAQEQAARAKAGREIGYMRTNGKTRQEERQVFVGVPGYTAGLCDHIAKSRANIQAQRIALVDQMVEQEEMANNPVLTPESREIAMALLTVTKAKLAEVNAQIALNAGYEPAVEQ